MPAKDLAPFSYVYPTENPVLMIKYELSTSCRWCQQTGSATAEWVVQKIDQPTNPATHVRENSFY